MIILDLLMHRYIRTGEPLLIYRGDHQPICQSVKVEGWGKYAAVLLNVGAIRRDQIRKDALGNWFYRYSDEYV